MAEFTVDDGWMIETSVRELAEWYHEQCPDTDLLSFETHLMAMSAYVTLRKESRSEMEAAPTRARYVILRLLAQSDDQRLLMGDLVHWMNVSPTNVTKLVDTLVADGLVERMTHDRDKRKTWAKLTPAGIGMVEWMVPKVAGQASSLWDCLTDDEKRTFVHLLAKVCHSALTTAKAASLKRELASA